jgi:hypothetical protein
LGHGLRLTVGARVSTSTRESGGDGFGTMADLQAESALGRPTGHATSRSDPAVSAASGGRGRRLKREAPMTEPDALYDHIGSKYDEYARTATLKSAERYTFFRMGGALEGKRVMDVAGFGFYTRLLKQRGAAQAVGVDISPEMIRLADRRERAEPLGVTYQVGDAVTLPMLGPLDLVTAVHVLTYATSKDQLLRMFRSVFANLVAGGRFIAYTNNPAFALSKPNSTKYGITVLSLEPEEDCYACEAEFATDPPFRIRWNQ